MLTLQQFNLMSADQQSDILESCCAAKHWIHKMVSSVPYESYDKLEKAAQSHWAELTSDDYLEAFEAHPMIGDLASLKAKYANTSGTAAMEQSSTQTASDEVLQSLSELNHAYLDKHGFIFIIFASGKSAEEMLYALQQRLPNDTQTEIKNAAAEQIKITLLRLSKLFKESA